MMSVMRDLATRIPAIALLPLLLLACGDDEPDDPWIDDDTDGARILPLGDSITQGDADHVSYRYALWTMLVDEGLDFDFVGNQTGNHEGDPVWPDHQGLEFDRDHEGHWGWHADQLLDELPGWLEHYDPEVVLLHIGTNDAWNEQPASQIGEEIGEIIEVLRDDVPEVVVLLARPLPIAYPDVDAILGDLSDELDSVVAEHDTIESPIVLVDMREGFDADADTYDGIHPDEGGEQKMAERWLEALLPYF
jgi:lysophospholipase L1-like esterase